MKKTLLVLLAVVIVVTAAIFGTQTASAATEGVLTYTVSNGEATITDCDTSVSGALLVPDTLGGYPVTRIGTSAFSHCSRLTIVEIPYGVTHIGYQAFYYCSSLTSIEIPDSVTSIGNQAFYYCSSLTSIEIPDSVTSIGSQTFYSCSSLTSVEIPDNETVILYQAFRDCTNLTSVIIPASVTIIDQRAFYGCSSLKTVYYTGNSEDWGKISIRSQNSPLTNAAHIYNYLGNDGVLVYIKNESEAQVYGFFGEVAASITIPSEVGGYKVTSIADYAFYNCSSLRSVEIPDSVTSIGKNAFYNTGYYNNEANWESGVKKQGILYIGNCLVASNLSGDTYKAIAVKEGTRLIADGALVRTQGMLTVYVTIPDSVVNIGADILESGRIYANENSTAHIYANENGIGFYNLTPAKAPPAPEVDSKTSDSVTLVAKDGYEYSLDGKNWQKENVFNGLDKVLEYKFYQRIAETSNRVASETSDALTVQIDDGENTTEFTGGVGKVYAPYLVSTKEHLDNVRKYPNAYFKQINDIVFTDDDFKVGGNYYNYGYGWTSIGKTEDIAFCGVYDGNGYSVVNLNVNIKTAGTVCGGLFGYNEGSIYNLTIKDSKISVSNTGTYPVYAGGIAAYSAGDITNCHNLNTTVTSSSGTDSAVGGIIGKNIGETVTECTNTGLVNGRYSGGIVGYLESGSAYNCVNMGKVQGDKAGGIIGYSKVSVGGCNNGGEIIGGYAGGIVGVGTSVNKCYNTGTVSTAEYTGFAGGIAGKCDSVSVCYNTGSVSSAKEAAGICASASSNLLIENCYNYGAISGYDVGGIFASMEGGSITKCYNVGMIISVSNSGYAGAIAAKHTGGTIKQCYYMEMSISGVGYVDYNLSVFPDTKGLTEEEMGKADSFAGFDFDSVWTMDGNGDYIYPELKDMEMDNVNPSYTVGDFDGNEGIDSDDAIYLLYSVLFGEETYPINQSADFDGNGVVDSDDAIYLLYHVLFGEEAYPLK